MAATVPVPSQGSLRCNRSQGNPPEMEPATPLLGRIDLTSVSKDPTPGEDRLVAEISASVSIAIATTPDDYDDPANTETPESQIRCYSINPSGKLTELAVVNTGFLTDGMQFSADGRQLTIATEGQPNADDSEDPIGSVSIIDISGQSGNLRFSEAEVTFPDLNSTGVERQGSGIRCVPFSGKSGITTIFAKDAEPEYVSAAGGHLFVTLSGEQHGGPHRSGHQPGGGLHRTQLGRLQQGGGGPHE